MFRAGALYKRKNCQQDEMLLQDALRLVLLSEPMFVTYKLQPSYTLQVELVYKVESIQLQDVDIQAFLFENENH